MPCRCPCAVLNGGNAVRWGHGTQGDAYGDKLHAWVSPAGRIMPYLVQPANGHDTTVGSELNRRWPDLGGPKIMGDKGSCRLGVIFPPKTKISYDTGWREDRHPKLRKRSEPVFSPRVEAQIRSVQTKTLLSLRFRVALAVLAHSLPQP